LRQKVPFRIGVGFRPVEQKPPLGIFFGHGSFGHFGNFEILGEIEFIGRMGDEVILV